MADAGCTPKAGASAVKLGVPTLSWSKLRGPPPPTAAPSKPVLISTALAFDEDDDAAAHDGVRAEGWLDGAASTVRDAMPTPARDDPKPTLWGLCRSVIGKVRVVVRLGEEGKRGERGRVGGRANLAV